MADFTKKSNFDPKNAYDLVRFGADSILLEAELNEAQEIIHNRVDNLIQILLKDGVLNANTIKATDVMEGKLVTVSGTYVAFKGRIYLINESSKTVKRNQSIVLEPSYEVLDGTSTIFVDGNKGGTVLTNKIVDDRLNTLTTKREAKYFKIVVKDTTAVKPVEMKIASVTASGEFEITKSPMEGMINSNGDVIIGGQSITDFMTTTKATLGKLSTADVTIGKQIQQLQQLISDKPGSSDFTSLKNELQGQITKVATRVTAVEGQTTALGYGLTTLQNDIGEVKNLPTTSKNLAGAVKELFQSGDESNKVLVDALISKNVEASTSDTIKTNVHKVKDINNIDDWTGSPGPQTLLRGNMSEGFFGFVEPKDLINGADLATMCGVTQGTLHNSDTRWAKFAYKGNILFTPLKSIRYGTSWDHLNTNGCAYGREISFGGNSYKVRLFKGARTDPAEHNETDRGAKGSEFNRLFLPLRYSATLGDWGNNSAYVEQDLPTWKTNLTSDNVGSTSGGNGSSFLCQELIIYESNHLRLIRTPNGFSGRVYSHNVEPDASGWRPVLEVIKPIVPGPQKLQAGTEDEGFYGFVKADDFITGDALAKLCNVTEGTVQNNNVDWLKFSWKGKILLRPQKTIRHSISWYHLMMKGCVYGDKYITIGRGVYRIRLMRGALTDPAKYDDSDKGAKGSEYNRLVLPLHEQARTGNWDYKEYVETDLPDWGVGLTNSDLGNISSANGRQIWHMEKTNRSGDYKVSRGNGVGASNSSSGGPGDTFSYFGWAPVLEYVGAGLPLSLGPGPTDLQAGTKEEGFYGFVEPEEFINGEDLAKLCEITEGELTSKGVYWLKFSWKGQVLFRPVKPIRHSISWSHIDSKGCVYGKNISFGGNTYKVRLMRGALTDPSKNDAPDKGAHGSEYNRLILPLHEDAKTGKWKYPKYVEKDLPNWGVGLTDTDFGTVSGANGACTWSMEKTNQNGDYKVHRGSSGGAPVTGLGGPGDTDSRYGWAPVLELVK